MSQPCLLGVDIGTSSVKAVAYSLEGRELGIGRRATPWERSALGTEMEPARMLDAVNDAIADSVAGSGAVIAVGVASMGESGVLIDASGSPCGPIIAWHDTRDADDVAALSDLGDQEFRARTGKPIRGQWSLTKYRWLARHGLATGAVRRLGVAEYVVRALGGDEVSELSLASRTGWLDLHQRSWWNEAMTFANLNPRLLPPLVEATHPVGRVTPGNRPLAGATLAVAGHDHQAAAVGVGALGAGAEVDSCGTAEALLRTITPGLDPALVGDLAEAGVTTDFSVQPQRWSLLGATEGGLAMHRALALLGVDRHALATLDAAAAAVTTPLPQISGIGGSTLQIHADETASPGALWRATVNETNDQLVTLQRAMDRAVGHAGETIVTGGWVHSTAFMQAKRDRFARVRVSGIAEAGTRGAALIAGVAAGELDDLRFASTTGEPS